MTLPTLTPEQSKECEAIFVKCPELRIHREGYGTLCFVNEGWRWESGDDHWHCYADVIAHALIFTAAMLWLWGKSPEVLINDSSFRHGKLHLEVLVHDGVDDHDRHRIKNSPPALAALEACAAVAEPKKETTQ